MREHPIPQDITGYRFHIIGNMTLKQFVILAAGFVVAAILYKIISQGYVKYPLMLFFVGFGALGAFVPIEERPLDHWILTFFQVLRRPTQFYWKRLATIPAPFLFTPNSSTVSYEDEVDLAPARRDRIKQFMASLTPTTQSQTGYTLAEQSAISNVLLQFQDPSITTLASSAPQQLPAKPHLTVRVRTMREEEDVLAETAHASNDMPTNDVVPPNSTPVSDSLDSASDLAHAWQDPSSPASAPYSELAVAAHATDVIVPELTQPTLENSTADTDPDQAMTSDQTSLVDESLVSLTEAPSQQSTAARTQAQTQTRFNSNLPFPATPTEPNKLVGMVLTNSGDLVPGAVIEVLDEDGEMARAVKSNALGQFFITTPLKKGKYILKIEKDSLAFATQELEVDDSVLEPIEVRATT